MTQRILSEPAIVREVKPLLETARMGQVMVGHQAVASTNTLAACWARAGAPEGSVVAAEFQTEGRGRLGRRWLAAPGLNLTFSIVLKPDLPVEYLGLITIAAGVAVAEAIGVFTAPLQPQIKWPNDILLNEKKCCGMLLETQSCADHVVPARVVLGIGLNVNQAEFPDEIEQTATSLCLEVGRMIPRAPLLAALLMKLEAWYDILLGGDAGRLRDAYRARMAALGKPVSLFLSNTRDSVTGTVVGIDEKGALQLRTGKLLRTYHAGEVTLRRDDLSSACSQGNG